MTTPMKILTTTIKLLMALQEVVMMLDKLMRIQANPGLILQVRM
jgi:hypothetical protein